MRFLLNMIVILTLTISQLAAQQDFEEKMSIQIKERASFFQMNDRYQVFKDTIFYSAPGFLVYPNYTSVVYNNIRYVALTYPEFSRKYKLKEYKKCLRTNKKRSKKIDRWRSKFGDTMNNGKLAFDSCILDFDYVNYKDRNSTPSQSQVHVEINGYNDKILAMKEADFMLLDKEDRYNTNWWDGSNYRLSFGMLTIPFKLRRPVADSVNFNLTTDITLGSYFGVTKRLSKTKRYYITLPATLGLSYININNSNTSNEKFEDEPGVVPGITLSTGIVFQFDDFNIGIVAGKDWASGIGKEWIYHGECWFSFAIGYNFLGQE